MQKCIPALVRVRPGSGDRGLTGTTAVHPARAQTIRYGRTPFRVTTD
jgi:hypothetical protein